jgi:site-specific DNA-methyltransferase (adenine-specific)
MEYPWLMLGDCLEKMKEIPDGSVDMILADLPYGTTACKWDVVIPFEPLWEQYWRVLKNNGVVALFGNEPFSSYLS